METNKCIKCGIEKPVSEFSKHCNTIRGIRNSCKTCESIAKKEWKKNNPEKVKAGKLKWKLKFSQRIKENGSEIKVCRTCKLEKQLSEYYTHPGRNCKECE